MSNPHQISRSQSTPSSSSSRQLDGDCGPLLKHIARKIQHKWRKVAEKLEFTPEDCEEFERNNNIKESWWPTYRMLLQWKTTLPRDKHGDFMKTLADAIKTFDDL